MNAKKILISLLVVLTVLRVVIVALEEPSPAEAYYFLCSQHPAAAYFDGPAGMATFVGWARAFGLPDVIWRMQAPLWALAATLACFSVVRRMGDEEKAAWAALLLNALPFFNMAALRVGPTMPALTFAFLAFSFGWLAFHAERRPTVCWLLTGAMIGLAAFFEYSAVALAPALLLFTLCSQTHRTWRDGKGLVLLVIVPMLMLAPAMIWNASQNWIPIAGGTLQTLWQFRLGGLVVATWQMLGSFSPLIFILFFIAWGISLRESQHHLRSRYVFIGAMPGVLMCVYFALRGMEGDFYLLLVAPLLLFKAVSVLSGLDWGRTGAAVAAALGILFSAYGMFNVYQTGHGWGGTADEVEKDWTENGEKGLFLVAEDASLASILSYHLRDVLVPPPGHPTVYVGESQDISNQFGLWPNYGDFVETDHPVQTGDGYFTEQKGENPFVGRSALYISREKEDELPQTIKAAFESVALVRRLPAAGAGKDALYIYLCLNYQTLPL